MRLILSILLALSLTAGCTTNPATGRAQLDFGMTQEQEISLGTEAAPSFLNDNGGEIPSPVILAYVRDVGARLAAQSERPDLPWEFHCLDSSQINAFALPGGKVFFSRGLLEKLPNEAAMAGVLGHEVGHVTGKHINERMAQSTLVGGLATAAGVAGSVSDNEWLTVLGVGSQVGGTLYLLKFNRDQESEADRLGIRYMANLGYNPVGMMQVMQILKEASGGGEGGGFEQMLATHPHPADRYKDAEKLIQKNYPDYRDTGKYIFGEDRFKQVVLANLAKLPKPRHRAMGPQQDKAQFAAAAAAARVKEQMMATAPLAAAVAPEPVAVKEKVAAPAEVKPVEAAGVAPVAAAAAPVAAAAQPVKSTSTAMSTKARASTSPLQPPMSPALMRALARQHQLLGNCECHEPAALPQAVLDAQDRR